MQAEFRRVKEIFLAALEKESRAERADYLSEACGKKEALRRQVEALLRKHEQAGSFLEGPPVDLSPTGDAQPHEGEDNESRESAPAEGPGTRIGPYKLLQQIGEGGMGVVYMAEQEQPVRRKVALKIIKPGMDSAQVIARFEAERQALAMMDHTHIAKVHDAGTTDTGRPYFVMELVHGLPITQFCDDNQLTPRERLALFVPVCQAIQHAHQKGIIHRDIKPSNVLVTLYDDKPVPKVIDFGVAKAIEQRLTEKTLFTQFGVLVGTFEYMSPEQAEMNAFGVDTRSDIYSLGVLLYELLTGTTPLEREQLRAAALSELVRLIKEEEPPRPSVRLSSSNSLPKIAAARKTEPAKLSKLVRGEIDWIVMKCLEKDRSRRYETANGLARDVERYLHDEAVEACPPSAGYRLRKFARKYWMPVTIGAAFALLLVAGVVVSTWQAVRAKRAESDAVLQRDLATDAAEEATMKRQEAEAAQYAANLSLMQQAWDSDQPVRLRALLAETERHPERGFEWYYWQRLYHLELRTLIGHRAEVAGVSWSPDGQRLATASWDRTAKVWEAASGRELRTLSGHAAAVHAVCWSPDGKRLATASFDQTAKVWDAADGRELVTLQGHTRLVQSVSWSLDGKRLATGSQDGTAIVWDPASGRDLLTLKGHTGSVTSLAWSPDGKQLATGSHDRTAKVWEVADGRRWLTLQGHTGGVSAVSWAPDGKWLATGSGDGTAKVWEASDGRELLTLKGHKNPIWSLFWAPDSKRLATGCVGGTAKVWDAVGNREILAFKGHTGEVSSVSWSPDGKRLATASYDGTAKTWDTDDDGGLVAFKRHKEGVSSLSYSPDGKLLATGSGDGTVTVWEAADGRKLLTFKKQSDAIDSVSWSPDGKRLATGSFDGTTKVCEVTDSREVLTLTGRGTCWSPDGTRLATVSVEGTAKVWDGRDGSPLLILQGHHSALSAVAWSPNSKRLATGSADGTAIVWDAADGRKRLLLEGHTSGVRSVSWSPDGKRLATGSDDGMAKVWNATDGRELLTLKGHTEAVSSVSWSLDSQRLATGSLDEGKAKVWDAASGQELLSLPGKTVSWSPDGKRVATGGAGGTVKAWDPASGTVKVWEAANRQAVQEWARQDRALEESLARNALRGGHAQGFIQTWLLLLPLPFDPQQETATAVLDRQQLRDEAKLRPRLGERVSVDGREFGWREHRSPQAILDFNAVVGRRTANSVAYAVCYLASDRARDDLWLKVGYDDWAKIYLSGQPIYQDPRGRLLNDLVPVGPVRLEQGTNALVFKVVNGTWDWEGCVRLVDQTGRPAEGIRIKLTPE
jgi:WD40 repeat protein/serine/threonine protein kinase